MDFPPFIVTLATMMVASGAAFLLADGHSIPELPASYTKLGRDADLLGIPNAVVLMGLTYLVAHLLLSRTVLGRHIYAVGDNRQAAWLSGIPVKRVLLFTYAASGLLAGVGGIVVASNYQSGDPRYGIMYELFVIAAVVVGGTSLSGGRGTVIGTLIGAFIIGVINNGMNLLQVNPYAQKVILGLVILGAVMLDKLKADS
jgi:ribose transport system permease protein